MANLLFILLLLSVYLRLLICTRDLFPIVLQFFIVLYLLCLISNSSTCMCLSLLAAAILIARHRSHCLCELGLLLIRLKSISSNSTVILVSSSAYSALLLVIHSCQIMLLSSHTLTSHLNLHQTIKSVNFGLGIK